MNEGSIYLHDLFYLEFFRYTKTDQFLIDRYNRLFNSRREDKHGAINNREYQMLILRNCRGTW